MPITCPIRFRTLDEAEFKRLDFELMRHVFASHGELGRLCDEVIYQHDIAARLVGSRLGPVRREVPVTVTHQDFSKTYFLDLVVADALPCELKTVTKLTGAHEAQLLNYLFLTAATHGKLVNLRPPSVGYRTVNNALTIAEQHRHELVADRWQELGGRGGTLRDLLAGLLTDWGASLELSLYQEALTHLLGGEPAVVRNIPLARAGIPLGHQPMHVLDEGIGLKLTALTDDLSRSEAHLRRLLNLTPLRALHWVNFNRHRIGLVTLAK